MTGREVQGWMTRHGDFGLLVRQLHAVVRDPALAGCRGCEQLAAAMAAAELEVIARAGLREIQGARHVA